MPEPASGLEIDQHLRFQQWFWTAERAAWLVFAAILLAAMLGFTGSGGPFARATIASGAAEVEYPRVARWGAHDRIEVTAPAGEPLTVGIGTAFLELFDIRTIVPQPAHSRVTGDGIRLEFAATEEAEGRSSVILDVVPTRPVLGAQAELTVGGESPARMSFVVLP
jgi:hypothetical protein